MKKFFAFVVAALVAFSFASCNKGGNDPSAGGFKIEISDVEATSAAVAVTPNDDTAKYYWNIIESEAYAELGENDAEIQAYFKDYIEYMIQIYTAYGYSFTFADFLSAGEQEFEFDELTANTKYVAFAFYMDENGVATGGIVKKEFKTKDVEKKGSKTITLTEGVCDDHCADNGWWQLMIADADTTVYLSISPLEADQLAGTWTIDDMDADYTLIYDAAEGENSASFVTFNATTTAEDGIFHLNGKGLASNGIEYTLDLTGEVTTSNDAPAAAPKKVRAANVVPAFNKHNLLKK